MRLLSLLLGACATGGWLRYECVRSTPYVYVTRSREPVCSFSASSVPGPVVTGSVSWTTVTARTSLTFFTLTSCTGDHKGRRCGKSAMSYLSLAAAVVQVSWWLYVLYVSHHLSINAHCMMTRKCCSLCLWLCVCVCVCVCVCALLCTSWYISNSCLTYHTVSLTISQFSLSVQWWEKLCFPPSSGVYLNKRQ